MDKIRLEFTFKGRKNPYFRRIDVFGKPLTTTNINSAKLIKESEIPSILKLMIKEYGKESITDVKPIKEG